MRVKVKLTYPTVVKIDDKEYTLFPGKEIDLPANHKKVKTLIKMRYIEPTQNKKGGG